MPKLNDVTISKQVGAAVEALREKRQVSRADMAKAMDISEVALHHYEKGRRRITLDALVLMAGLLNKPVVSLLKDVDLSSVPDALPKSPTFKAR